MKQSGTRKTILIFGAASFLNDFGSDMIYPIWPLFVTTLMGANMMELGFIDGLGDAVVSISQALSGYLSDRIGKRKIFVWLGYSFGAISRVGYAFSSAWQMLVPFRVLDRAGKIRSAPRDAIVANLSSNTDRGKNFGFIRMLDNLGAVCGILACMLLMQSGFSVIFLVAAIPSVIGSVLIISMYKERKEHRPPIFKGIAFHYKNPNFILFLVVNAIFSVGAFSYSFLLLFSKSLGFGATTLPVLYLIFTVVAALCSLPFGSLSDRWGRKNVLMLSFFFWIATCACFSLVHTPAGVIGCFILYGLHKGALEPVQRALVAELVPPEYRASIIGGFQMVVGLSALPSSLLAGIVWEYVAPSAPFLVSMCLTVIAMILLWRVKITIPAEVKV